MTASLVKFSDISTVLAVCTLCGDMTRGDLDAFMLGPLQPEIGHR